MAPATYTWWTTNEVGDDAASVPSDTRKSEYTCAWMFADDAHVTNELYHTAQRLGVDLDATYFDVLPASRLSATCSGVSTSASSRQSCSTDDTPMHLMLQPTESVRGADGRRAGIALCVRGGIVLSVVSPAPASRSLLPRSRSKPCDMRLATIHCVAARGCWPQCLLSCTLRSRRRGSRRPQQARSVHTCQPRCR